MIYCCGLIQQNRLYQKYGPIRKYGPLTKRAVHIYKNQVLLKDIQIQRSLETKVYIYVVIMQKTALMIKLCLIGVSISLCKTTLLKDSKLSANEVHASSCMRHGGGSQSEPASATQVPIRSRFLRFRVFSGPKPGNSESRCHTNREHHSLATGGCDWCGNMWDTSHKVASQWGKWW